MIRLFNRSIKFNTKLGNFSLDEDEQGEILLTSSAGGVHKGKKISVDGVNYTVAELSNYCDNAFWIARLEATT